MIKAEEVKETIKIENVVASTAINQEINLENMVEALETADYAPNQFPGLVYHTHDPKTAILLFNSGQIVCTGADNIEDVYKALDKIFQKLRTIDINIKQPEVTIQNIVATADLKTEVNLNAIAIGVGLENIEYEPEQFPGLVYRLTTPKAVLLIFTSGKLVITGTKKPKHTQDALEKTVKKLQALQLL